MSRKPIPEPYAGRVREMIAALHETYDHVVAIDFETYYGKKYSLTSMTYVEYLFHPEYQEFGASISIDGDNTQWYEGEELAAILSEIPWERTCVIGQNLKFDASILCWKHGLPSAAGYIDLMDMANAWWPGEKASLGEVTQRLWPDDSTMWKGKELASFYNKRWEDLDADMRDIMRAYCDQDNHITLAAAAELFPRIPFDERRLIDLTLRLYIEPRLYLDRERAANHAEELMEEKRELVKQSGLSWSRLSSNQKFAEWMRSVGIEVPRKINPKGEETDALGQKDPEFLATMADWPSYQHVWNARAAVKSTINVSRAQRFVDIADTLNGLIPVPLKYYGAHSSRWSGNQKQNMQNLPRKGELRKSLVVEEGYFIYVVDSSNIEARMLAWLVGESKVLAMLRNGEDLYNDMASKIYGYPVFRKQENEDGTLPFYEEGNVGKTARLGLGYGMGSPKFRGTLASGPMGSAPILVSADFAQMAVSVFRSDNPATVRFWQFMNSMLELMMLPDCDARYGPLHFTHETIWLPNGMPLRYPNMRKVEDQWPDGSPKQSIVCTRGGKTVNLYGGIMTENVVQALARIVVAQQILWALDEFPDARLLMTTHDEGAFRMPDDNADDRQERLNHLFTRPPDWCPDLPLGSEGGYARNYSK